MPYKQGVIGSSPVAPTKYPCNVAVTGVLLFLDTKMILFFIIFLIFSRLRSPLSLRSMCHIVVACASQEPGYDSSVDAKKNMIKQLCVIGVLGVSPNKPGLAGG